MSLRFTSSFVVSLLAWVLLFGSVSAMSVSAAEQVPPEVVEEVPPPQEPAPSEVAEEGSEQADPCAPPVDSDDLWAARMRRGVFRTVCNAAIWVDSAFGDSRNLPLSSEDESKVQVNGRLFLRMGYDEIEGIDPSVKLRARIPLPRLRNRFNALIGRADLDDVVSDRDERFDRLPDALRDTDEEWLLGLGYSPVRTTRSRVDFDAGVRLDFPLDPFVRGRLRRVVLINDSQLIRLRETVFWRNAKGWGVTSATDFERIFTENFLVRSSLSGTFAQETEGVDYNVSVTLFQNLGKGGALAYKALVFGETDDPVPVEEYGLVLIHRRRFLRDWLFLEIAPGVGWRRRELEDQRETAASIRFGLEMLFGAERRKP